MSLGNLKYVKTLRQNLEVKTEATNSKLPMCNLKKYERFKGREEFSD